MFEIKMTINGKPLTEANFTSEFDKMIAEASLDSMKEHISSVLSEDEASKLTIELEGPIENLSVNVKGPEDIVTKLESTLSN